jgi:transposase-like protein
MVVSIQGRRMYLWRAVDSEGEVLDLLVQPKRDTAAALRLMRKLLMCSSWHLIGELASGDWSVSPV